MNSNIQGLTPNNFKINVWFCVESDKYRVIYNLTYKKEMMVIALVCNKQIQKVK